MSTPDYAITNKPYRTRANRLMQKFMIGLASYVLLSYMYLGEENLEGSSSDDGGDGGAEEGGTDGRSGAGSAAAAANGTKFLVAVTPRNQLLVSTAFAVLGAYVGHHLADVISKSMRGHPLIPAETLVCNALFGLLGLSLDAFKLLDPTWGDSLMLRGFAINFCGAASLFARHVSDNRRLYAKRWRGLWRAWINIAVNVMFATIVFWVAFEIEEWERPTDTRRGVVVKIMKILERRRRDREARQ